MVQLDLNLVVHPSLAQIHMSSCDDWIPRRPHRKVTFGIIILLSRLLLLPWDIQWDELAFCSISRSSTIFKCIGFSASFFFGWNSFSLAEISSSLSSHSSSKWRRRSSPHFENKLLLMTVITDSGGGAKRPPPSPLPPPPPPRRILN